MDQGIRAAQSRGSASSAERAGLGCRGGWGAGWRLCQATCLAWQQALGQQRPPRLWTLGRGGGTALRSEGTGEPGWALLPKASQSRAYGGTRVKGRVRGPGQRPFQRYKVKAGARASASFSSVGPGHWGGGARGAWQVSTGGRTWSQAASLTRPYSQECPDQAPSSLPRGFSDAACLPLRTPVHSSGQLRYRAGPASPPFYPAPINKLGPQPCTRTSTLGPLLCLPGPA